MIRCIPPPSSRPPTKAAWPCRDAETWQRAIATGGPLDPCGPAARWSPASQKLVADAYGRFLQWLESRGELDRAGGPGDRVTPERLSRYVIERRSRVAIRTVFNDVGMLAMMMRILVPDRDWRWLTRHPLVPTRAEARAARREPRLFDPGLLLHRLMARLEELQREPACERTAILIRDHLLVAFAVCSGLRMRNLAAIRIGENLVARPHGWDILFEAHETKAKVPIALRWPEALRPFLGQYLAAYRPVLLRRCKTPLAALWVSARGNSLSMPMVHLVFARIGRETIGRPINPHCVRHTLATTLLTEDPNALAVAAAALAHRGTDTVVRYYDESTSAPAQMIWQRLKQRTLQGAADDASQRHGAGR